MPNLDDIMKMAQNAQAESLIPVGTPVRLEFDQERIDGDEVHADGSVADQRLAGSRLRKIDIRPLDRVRPAVPPHHLRQAGGQLSWEEDGEGLGGSITVDPGVNGDVVLARKEIPASYHLAVTVDDALQGVTLVTRGRDLFAATHVHRLLQALLADPVSLEQPRHDREDLPRIDRLGEIVRNVGADGVAQGVRLLALRHHDHRHRLVQAADGAEDLEPAPAGHVLVEQDDAVRLPLEEHETSYFAASASIDNFSTIFSFMRFR